MGLYPIGMALAGPVASVLGLQETLLAMSAVGVVVALAWLAQPSVRAVRPEHAAAPRAAERRRPSIRSPPACRRRPGQASGPPRRMPSG